jgi:methylphosphotriester-DNA--protein-cysteine methyltransferase
MRCGQRSPTVGPRDGDDQPLRRASQPLTASVATIGQRTVGEPPLAYLRSWRRRIAAHRLKHTTEPVESIARDVGYTSEYPFNRAFSAIVACPRPHRRLARAA